MPWAASFGGVSALAFVQFAYRFPGQLPGARREARWVGAAMALCVCAEIASSAYTGWTLVQQRIWFRPDWAASWTSISLVWAMLVFLRQLGHAQGGSRPEGLGAGLRAITRRPANRDARAARGFILFSLLPLAHTLALVFQQDGRLGPLSIEWLISWSALIQLAGLTLVYFGYLPERSSFIFKLTIISLVLLFGAINGACWVLSTPYRAQYQPAGLPSAGSALEFTPRSMGGYTVRDVPAQAVSSAGQPNVAPGGRMALPFALPFYGRRYEAVHIAADGSIGPSRPADHARARAAHRCGAGDRITAWGWHHDHGHLDAAGWIERIGQGFAVGPLAQRRHCSVTRCLPFTPSMNMLDDCLGSWGCSGQYADRTGMELALFQGVNANTNVAVRNCKHLTSIQRSISMTKRITALAIIATLFSGITFANSAHAQSPCKGVSGYYGNVTAIIVGADGKTVNITLANDRPLAYGTCTPDGKLSINFKSPDDTPQGQFDGKVIKWSNNTTWTKQPMCWVGGPADKPACK